jgi:hypothetical protein
MDIRKLYECLTTGEKHELRLLLKNIDESKYLSVRDFIKTKNVNVRILNVLNENYETHHNCHDITVVEFKKLRNLGGKSWVEFLGALGN